MSHETNLAAFQHLVTSCLVLSNGCVCSYITDSLQKFRIILIVHWRTHFLLNIVHQLRHVHMGHTKHIQVLGNGRHCWQSQREHSAVSSLAEPDSHTKSGRDGESCPVSKSVGNCKQGGKEVMEVTCQTMQTRNGNLIIVPRKSSPPIMWRTCQQTTYALRHIMQTYVSGSQRPRS